MKYLSLILLLVLVASCGNQANKIKDTDHSVQAIGQVESTTWEGWDTTVEEVLSPKDVSDTDNSEDNTIELEEGEKNTKQDVKEQVFKENKDEVDPEEANKWLKMESDPVEDNAVIQEEEAIDVEAVTSDQETTIINEETVINVIADESTSELDSAVGEISEDAGTSLTRVEAEYTNPKWAVDMVIEYSLDADWKITNINTTATTYDLTKFQEKVTDVVWKTVKEASEMYFSGSSLTTEAFQKAMKSQIK